MPDITFRAFVATHADERTTRAVHSGLTQNDLGLGEVLIRVGWSSVNYKDGLACTRDGNVTRQKVLIPGIDLAGTIVATAVDSSLTVGDDVIVHGYDLGVAHHGGFSEFARVPEHWVVPLPDELTTREAMSIGTAGFTAALSVKALEDRGLRPDQGTVLVTGASGGVGSVAVDILAGKGYDVTASTGTPEATTWLTRLGAKEVIGRGEVGNASRPLNRQRWAGAIDCVGGSTLSSVLSTLHYGACVAASGNTGGTDLITTVFPFILRGVSLTGIDSVQYPIDERRILWHRLANDLRPRHLSELATEEVTLDGLDGALEAILTGKTVGRTVVRL